MTHDGQTIDLRPALWGLGLCGVLSSLTTFSNILLPRFYPPPADFDARIPLLSNAFYMARQYILLLHPVLTLTGALGMALYLLRSHPGKATTGFFFAFSEKITEFYLGTTMVFTVLRVWLRGYAGTDDPVLKAAFRGRVEWFFDMREGAFVVLWATFIISSVLYGLALWRGRRLKRAVSLLYFSTSLLTVLMFLGDYGGQTWVEPILAWSYAPLLTANRLFAGILLMRAGSQREATQA